MSGTYRALLEAGLASLKRPSVSRSMPSKVSGALDREDMVCAAAPGDHLAANIGALEEVAASSPSSKFNSAKGAPEA